MEQEIKTPFDNGMSIRIEGNSIKFMTKSKVYYKNLTNFVQDILKGKKSFNAPESISLVKAETPA
jgi:hypothetical protein